MCAATNRQQMFSLFKMVFFLTFNCVCTYATLLYVIGCLRYMDAVLEESFSLSSYTV